MTSSASSLEQNRSRRGERGGAPPPNPLAGPLQPKVGYRPLRTMRPNVLASMGVHGSVLVPTMFADEVQDC